MPFESATPDHPGPPPLAQSTFLTCRAHYPGGSTGAWRLSVLDASASGFFPV